MHYNESAVPVPRNGFLRLNVRAFLVNEGKLCILVQRSTVTVLTRHTSTEIAGLINETACTEDKECSALIYAVLALNRTLESCANDVVIMESV